ncbi:MAG: hypothetical protein M3Y87_11140 [Myxococcota bacterium]|nr:hypothetical protein [Myxococcota bacterium]
MRVRWSLTEPSVLPANVDRISLDVFVEGEADADNSIHTVENLEDADMNGRRELIRGGLPTGEPIWMRITGEVGGAAVYVGHVGPIVLRAGERRYVEPFMFRIDDSTALPSTMVQGRLLHSATALPDGRVLIAGGYDSATMATCPAGEAEGSRCFTLEASDEALVFDPSEARFHVVRGGMTEARGGHTGTALPDGRVLLAGGASEALLVMIPQGPAAAPTGFAIDLRPRRLDDTQAALATFEIFDPEASPEEEDVDSDGDPGRGGFVGAADAPAQPGRLDRARFLATASPVPGTRRVIIAGGLGDPSSRTTFVVFDADRAGGYGVLDNPANVLAASRVAAGSIAVGSGASAAVWMIGGTPAADDAALAEVWSPSATDPNGASASAAAAPLMFPQQMTGTPASHPEWSLAWPLLAPIDGGTHVLAVGWYGPRCAVGDPMPVFAGVVDPTELCGVARTRNFTVDVGTGLAVPTSTHNPHAFGASAVLDDGRALFSGGISTLQWNATNTIDVFTGEVDASGAAALSPTPILLEAGRALHSATPLRDGGMLVFGGVSFGLGVNALSFPPAEVLYLAR